MTTNILADINRLDIILGEIDQIKKFLIKRQSQCAAAQRGEELDEVGCFENLSDELNQAYHRENLLECRLDNIYTANFVEHGITLGDLKPGATAGQRELPTTVPRQL